MIKGAANIVKRISDYKSESQGKQALQSSWRFLNKNHIYHIYPGQSLP